MGTGLVVGIGGTAAPAKELSDQLAPILAQRAGDKLLINSRKLKGIYNEDCTFHARDTNSSSGSYPHNLSVDPTAPYSSLETARLLRILNTAHSPVWTYWLA